MMLKTQITADRTAASAASFTASPLVHRLHGPGRQITHKLTGMIPAVVVRYSLCFGSHQTAPASQTQ
ncbi:hypothetical protein PAMP_007816 [Pampus punctatissimus]